MARTTISKTSLPGGTTNGVGFEEFVWTAADVGNGNQFVSTGKEVLMIRNTNTDSPATSHNVIVYKTAGRIELTLSSGEYACTGQIPAAGWRQSDDKVYFNADHAEVEFAVLVLP